MEAFRPQVFALQVPSGHLRVGLVLKLHAAQADGLLEDLSAFRAAGEPAEKGRCERPKPGVTFGSYGRPR